VFEGFVLFGSADSTWGADLVGGKLQVTLVALVFVGVASLILGVMIKDALWRIRHPEHFSVDEDALQVGEDRYPMSAIREVLVAGPDEDATWEVAVALEGERRVSLYASLFTEEEARWLAAWLEDLVRPATPIDS
jgi:hypothetical protein